MPDISIPAVLVASGSAPTTVPVTFVTAATWAHLRDRLDARSRDIVQRRWMTEGKATLHQLAQEYGVSAERIRQIEASALGKLRGLMAA